MTLELLEPVKEAVKFEGDPLISFIVPIYNIEPMILKRCLMSLKDQDYENKEVVCVFDGENNELKKIAESFTDFKIIQIEHAGACSARNAGFKESKGEIVSFFNSDYIAKPGMVRMWVNTLKKNKDFGFVYGGYEYASSKRHVYPSKKFDPWELEIANYIDCGFPLWRKYVVEWDENCKSLQDWDFWLRVIKTHKIKGFYIEREYSFIAELPRSKGLSDDSHNNWIDRVTYIKNKNGIPLRDLLVVSTGASYHAKEIAKLIGGDYRDDTFDKPSDYKALYMIGFYIMPNETGLNENARRLAMFKEKYPKAKRIVHFVGADIYWLRKFPWESLKLLSGVLQDSCDHILCENQTAQDELRQYGIEAEIVPIPSYTLFWEVTPLPKDFSVAIYMVEQGYDFGKSDFDKYCYEHTLSIIRGMPDIQFKGYGLGGKDLNYPNFKHAGIIPRDKWPIFVYDSSAYLRICRHDHHPMASNEFLMAGRSVITNIPTYGSDYIDTGGQDKITSWDKFETGLSAEYWPDTKKKFVQMIRMVKDRSVLVDSGNVFANVSNKLKSELDQKIYINKIKELCK